MINVLLGLLIIAIIGTGAYYAAHYIVQLRHNRDILADEYKRATVHIEELESRIIMLEADRDLQSARMSDKQSETSTGYEFFNTR